MQPVLMAALALVRSVGASGSELTPCPPANKASYRACTNITSPCSRVQEYLGTCIRDPAECNANVSESKPECDEACGRCVPVCSPKNIVMLKTKGTAEADWGRYCRLPECPRPSAYLTDAGGCKRISDYEYALSDNCVAKVKGKNAYVLEHRAITCPLECGVCNSTSQPTAPPTARPTSSPGPRRKKITTKKGTAGSFLFGALYIEIAVAVFLLFVLVILIRRRIRKRQKEETMRKANRVFKRL